MSHVGRRACRMSEQGRGRCGRRSGFSERRADGGELLRCVLPDAVLPGKKRRGLRSSYGEKDGEKRQRGRPVPFLDYLGNIIQEAVNGDGCRASRKRRAMPDIPAGRMRRASPGKRSRSSQGGSGVFFRKGPCCRRGRDAGGSRLYHGVLLLLRASCREKEGPWPRCWCSVWEMY